MELWDLYNEKRELTGRDHVRGEAIPEGCYHMVVHVWIRNSRGEFLLSRRSANRPTFPLMWECVGGSVLKGESSLCGAVREVREEIGLSLSPGDGKLLRCVTRDVINGVRFADILDIWLFEYDGDVPLEKATTDEVEQVKWMTKSQVKELLDAGKMVRTLDYFFSDVCTC